MPGLLQRCVWLCVCVVMCSIGQRIWALELPQIFASHMVLQRDMPVRIWGVANPGQHVHVQFAGQIVSTTAQVDGKWQMALQAMAANAKAQAMTINTGEKTLVFEDILVGEVWLCSGQSNMEWPVRRLAEAEDVIEEATDPLIRLAGVARHFAQKPQFDTKVIWAVNSPKAIPNFTAVGYYFGHYLREQLGVPIGLIRAAWGGTPAEAWTSQSTLDANANLQSVKDIWQWQQSQYPKRLAAWEQAMSKVTAQRQQWLKEHSDMTAKDAQLQFRTPRKPYPAHESPFAPPVLFNGMIHPIAPFTLRGVIWYQGESNAGRPDEYRHLLPAMINNWRDLWQQSQLPFGLVQLANFHKVVDYAQPPVESGWAHLRDAQCHTAMNLPHVGLATIIDIGDANTVHPLNKLDVGKRLGLWAMHDVYGKDIDSSGPVYKTCQVVGDRMILTFDHVGGGLKTTNGKPLTDMIIAGSDKQWQWAWAKIISPDRIEVWAEKVPQPVAVRYAWADNPANPNLTNTSGLPASPFRTDDWPFGH